MKKMKSLLCIMLAAVMMLSAVPAFAASPAPDRPVVNTESGLNGAVCAKEDFDMSVYAAKAHITESLNFPDKLNGFDANKPKNILVIVSGDYGIEKLVGKTIKTGYKFDVYDYRNGVYTFIVQYDMTNNKYNSNKLKAEEVPANPAAMIAPYSLTVNASGFTDLKEGDPHYAAIMALVKNDIIAGYADGRFGADDPIMQVEAGRVIARLRNDKYSKPASETAPYEYDSPLTRGYQMGTMSAIKRLAAKTNLTIDQIPAEDAAKLRAYATEHPVRIPGKMTDAQLKKGIDEELSYLVRGYNTGYLSSIGGVGDMDGWITRGELCQIFYDLGYTTWGSLK